MINEIPSNPWFMKKVLYSAVKMMRKLLIEKNTNCLAKESFNILDIQHNSRWRCLRIPIRLIFESTSSSFVSWNISHMSWLIVSNLLSNDLWRVKSNVFFPERVMLHRVGVYLLQKHYKRRNSDETNYHGNGYYESICQNMFDQWKDYDFRQERSNLSESY